MFVKKSTRKKKTVDQAKVNRILLSRLEGLDVECGRMLKQINDIQMALKYNKILPDPVKEQQNRFLPAVDYPRNYVDQTRDPMGQPKEMPNTINLGRSAYLNQYTGDVEYDDP